MFYFETSNNVRANARQTLTFNAEMIAGGNP